MVFDGINSQKLVGIAAVVLILQKFEYFVRLVEKCLFMPLSVVFMG